jgi:hypothetical protein
MSTTTEPKPKPPVRTRPRRAVVGSIKRRKVERTNKRAYYVYRARLVDPENRAARLEKTFSELAYGGIAKAKLAAESWLSEQRDGINGGSWLDPRKPAPVDPGTVMLREVAGEWVATWDTIKLG